MSAWDKPELMSPGPVVLSPGRMDSSADRRAFKAGKNAGPGRWEGVEEAAGEMERLGRVKVTIPAGHIRRAHHVPKCSVTEA